METTTHQETVKTTSSDLILDGDLIKLLEDNKQYGSTVSVTNMGDRIIRQWFIVITPDLAANFLSRNISNRPLSKANVSKLGRQMKNGYWHYDGQPIRFDSLGRLCDGQHRLTAIINSNITETFTVISGLDPNVFKTMDTGKKRDGADAFTIEGIVNAAQAAATTKFVHGFKAGKYSIANSITILNNEQLIDEYYKLNTNGSLDKSVRFGKYLSQKSSVKLMSPTLLSGFHYLFTELDEELGVTFLESLYLGINLTTKSPIYKLRQNLERAMTSSTYVLTDVEMVKQITYIWNKVRKNEEVKIIKISDSYVIEVV